ncbi:TlpA family protein disulfide reductase [Mesocricetibacter intestinalis]|uniref:TlpA family protein disulfide reductase n=1 Tax=Mesocricetibacter intestinalis TaxID=1521930 RepID=UPI00105B8317|nr:TlpA disulfide reductase family protein [Mesocricetibacter intestinalis]
MKINPLLKTLFLTTVIFSLISCKEERAEIGRPAPALATFDLQGNKTELSRWRGKPTLLNFWSETCGACIAELKQLEELSLRYPDKLHIVAVNIDGEKADTQGIVEKYAIRLPVVKDQLKITGERYQIIGTPTSVLLDQEGILQAKYEGLIPHSALQELFTRN